MRPTPIGWIIAHFSGDAGLLYTSFAGPMSPSGGRHDGEGRDSYGKRAGITIISYPSQSWHAAFVIPTTIAVFRPV
jgi:hypothetical protein